MKKLYKNEFKDVYEADTGEIVKVMDPESMFDTKLMYVAGGTDNGYCYKDYNNFNNNFDEVCYIAESCFDETLFVDYVKENKEKLISEGGVSTANSIKEEVRNCLIYDKYYYEYEKNGVVHIIEAKDFDEELINLFAQETFDIVDWQTTQALISEIDWSEDISQYYNKKLKNEEIEI